MQMVLALLYFVGFGIAMYLTKGDVFVLGWGIFMIWTGIVWIRGVKNDPPKWWEVFVRPIGFVCLLMGILAVLTDLSQR